MNTTEKIARAICGNSCRLQDIRGKICPDGMPCQAELYQLLLSDIGAEANAVMKVIVQERLI